MTGRSEVMESEVITQYTTITSKRTTRKVNGFTKGDTTIGNFGLF